MSVILLVVSLLLFIGLIVVHEFGHFIAARRSGVEVEEFGIFFPPTLYKHKTKAAEDQLTGIGLPGHKLQTISTVNDLPNITKSYAGQLVDVAYKQGGHTKQVEVRLLTKSVVSASLKTNNQKGYLGVSPINFTLRRSTWSAPIVAVGFSIQATVLTFQGLGHAVAGLGSLIAGAATGNTAARQNGQSAASSQVSGPIGIFVILKDGSVLGYQFMLFIIAIISLTLAIMNILPIPALDGGRLWITLVARAFKRPLSAHVEEIVNASGFVILIGLSILIAIVDIHRFF
jgi:regulator of sigma E protease